MFESYEVGARCWVVSQTAGWVSATVEEKKLLDGGAKCELALWVESGSESGERRTVTISQDPAPEVPLRNPPALEATSDLVTLSYLNEPSVLHAIRQRYAQLNIYTFSGIVLIATNPFDRVDNLYTNEVVQMYSGRQRGELEPHLFSIAEDAFRCMQMDGRNQTIVVSGESGAGKTMSAKYIMRYFATVEDPAKRPASGSVREVGDSAAPGEIGAEFDGLSRVEREILATNPIMESFGNAKTTRNDNSSRFGKYLEIRFDNNLEISGARIRTYLLERSRIVFHPSTERNYHIFYQLFRGLPAAELESLGLTAGLESFHYVNQGGDGIIAGVDDGADFRETCKALEVVGVDKDQQWHVFQLLAALLHLGNIELKATSRSVLVSSEDPALVKTAELLGIPADQLSKWLMKKQIQMRSESIVSDLDAKTAQVVRDSIAKYLYSALFDWLVAAVNLKLCTGGSAHDRFIGVLDIYGFEHFKHNSFEQFCINYANEKLQQEFNQHVFKLEQDEYKSEEIDWQYIDFVDNQPCITLIEARMGILALLDEESRLPAGTDDGFTQKLYGSLTDKPNFLKPRLGQSSFIVQHYAHDVEYETDGFIEKNRDTVPDTVVGMLHATSNPFLSQVLQAQATSSDAEDAKKANEAAQAQPAGPGRRGAVVKRPTLGNIFKTSLIELMETISSTNAHYIRCIKPNEAKEAWQFDGPMVLSQLRACGVLETIRISSQGFPGRWMYEEFARRYELLLHSSIRNSTKNPREITLAVLEDFMKRRNQGDTGESDEEAAALAMSDKRQPYALGKTKVFLRAGMLAQLENMRTKRQTQAAIQIQRYVKMRSARNVLVTSLAFINSLQVALRGKLARDRAERVRAERATVGVQALARRFLQRSQLQKAVTAVTGVQRITRARQARQRAIEQSQHEAATSIQTIVRARQVKAKHDRQVHALTIVQSMVRRRGARRQLQALKDEQHSVKHYEETQYRMENKVVELQNALSQKREDHKSALEQLTSVEAARALLEEELNKSSQAHNDHVERSTQQHRELTQAVDHHRSLVDELEGEVASRSEQIEQLRDTLAEQEQLVQKLQTETAELRQRNRDLQEQLSIAHTAAIGSAPLAAHHRQQLTADLAAQAHQGARGQNGRQVVVSEYEASAKAQEINDEIEMMLREQHGVREELLSKLIRSLELPSLPTKLDERLPEREVLFPANITNLLISEMWKFGFIAESERLIGTVLRTIQETLQKVSGEPMAVAAPFWLSNVQEIYSFLTLAESNIIQNPQLREQMRPEELQEYATLTKFAKQDVMNVIFNIYYVYMKEVKKILNKMIVAAVVEEQSIPGFKTEQQTAQPRIWAGLFGNNAPAPKMDDVIMLLNKIYSALVGYHLEEMYVKQPLKEIMELIGAKAFNDMVMRRNFLSWRRGVQISYNVTRIDEWSKGHNFPEGGSSLEPLAQSAKLLQLKKNFEQDISIIYDICWSLTPTQIQRIVSSYQSEDYEPPISEQTMQLITRRIKEDKNSTSELLIPVRQLNDSGPFEIAPPRILDKLEPYIPDRLDVPKLREFTELTTTSSRLNEEFPDEYGPADDSADLGEASGDASLPVEADSNLSGLHDNATHAHAETVRASAQ